jgi:hypothetical protein
VRCWINARGHVRRDVPGTVVLRNGCWASDLRRWCMAGDVQRVLRVRVHDGVDAAEPAVRDHGVRRGDSERSSVCGVVRSWELRADQRDCAMLDGELGRARIQRVWAVPLCERVHADGVLHHWVRVEHCERISVHCSVREWAVLDRVDG